MKETPRSISTAMRGSVLKKGDHWYVKIELDPDPGTGRRRQKWHSGYRTKRDAERARIELLSKVDRGEYVPPSQQTVAEFFTDWLTAIQATVRPSTIDSYRRNVHLHVIAHIGSPRLSRVDAGVLNGLYATLLVAGRRPSSRKGAGYPDAIVIRAHALREQALSLAETAKQLRSELPDAANISKDTLASLLRRATADPPASSTGLDPRTVAYIHTIIHRACKDAVRWGRLARNPADAADPPRAIRKTGRVQAWDADTLRGFLDISRIEGDRRHALWVVLATTGLRRGEALGLRWSDVDLDAARIRIVQTVIQIRSTVSIGEPKTASGRRSVKIDRATIGVLRAHRQRTNSERLLVGPDFN
ncbi:MAG TPA: Arm DNA-binding domain-containing protein, partial [Mycobacteriales bacterium]|nr:Arm DNA-binding domain-containing protein [Mycobacteriales bacterium]